MTAPGSLRSIRREASAWSPGFSRFFLLSASDAVAGSTFLASSARTRLGLGDNWTRSACRAGSARQRAGVVVALQRCTQPSRSGLHGMGPLGQLRQRCPRLQRPLPLLGVCSLAPPWRSHPPLWRVTQSAQLHIPSVVRLQKKSHGQPATSLGCPCLARLVVPLGAIGDETTVPLLIDHEL
jgi:hypothetical protein